jgi:hypothetical protein
VKTVIDGVIAGLEMGIEENFEKEVEDLAEKFKPFLAGLTEQQRKDLMWLTFHRVISRKVKGLKQ